MEIKSKDVPSVFFSGCKSEQCICVCALPAYSYDFVIMNMSVYSHVYTGTRDQCLCGVFFYCSSPQCPQVSGIQLHCIATELWGSSCLYTPVPSSRVTVILYLCSEDPNQGPHACRKRTFCLSTHPTSQPQSTVIYDNQMIHYENCLREKNRKNVAFDKNT